MCLLAVFFQVAADAPLVVAANREEAYRRGGSPPTLHRGGRVPFVAGTDPDQGGTWLGVNAQGVLVAVTNRAKTAPPERPRSRGLLTRDLLQTSAGAAEAAERAAHELEGGAYAGCSVLCADAGRAVVLHGGDWLRVRPLPAGVYVLANGDVDDELDPRTVFARARLRSERLRTAADCVAASERLLRLHEPAVRPVCLRLPERGTVSSSVIVLRPVPGTSMFRHAQGPPDVTPYADVSPLLREIGL